MWSCLSRRRPASQALSFAFPTLSPCTASSYRLFVRSFSSSDKKKKNKKKNKDDRDSVLRSDLNVTIVGRPNVGKSTLFNRLTLNQRSLIHKTPGVTRDVSEDWAQLGNLQFRLKDTAGLEDVDASVLHTNAESRSRRRKKGTHGEEKTGGQVFDGDFIGIDLQRNILRHTKQAVEAADIVLFLFDARQGVTSVDRHFAQWLRKTLQPSVPVVLVSNKCESLDDSVEAGVMEGYELGFGDPVPISAHHGDNMADLFLAFRESVDSIPKDQVTYLRMDDDDDEESRRRQGEKDKNEITLGIVGRPNAGKSSLINSLLGFERVLVGEQAGITRDVITTEWTPPNQSYNFRLVDTAGVRGTSAISRQKFSQIDGLAMTFSLRAIEQCDVTALVVDAAAGVQDVDVGSQVSFDTADTHQLLVNLVSDIVAPDDLAIAAHALAQGKPLVLILNKWDRVAPAKRDLVLKGMQLLLNHQFDRARGVPVLATNALEDVAALVPIVTNLFEKWGCRIPTSKLNVFLREVKRFHPPPKPDGKPLSLRFISQTATKPPTFFLPCSRASKLPKSYVTFLTNLLREEFDLEGIPLRVDVRLPENPYTDADRRDNDRNKKSKPDWKIRNQRERKTPKQRQSKKK